MKLLEPFTLGKLELKNRIVMAPLTRARAGLSRVPNDLMKRYYQQRQSAGLIIAEATTISTDGIGWQQSPGIYSNSQVDGWRKITEGVATPIFLQLWHCGRASHSAFPEREGKLPAAPSSIILNDEGIHTPQGKLPYEKPRSLTVSEIKATINDYKEAAKRAKEAGFAGIEIHSANGYLLDQFLQSKTNQRTDEWGGNIERRFKLLQEVVEVCLSIWSPSQIGVRLSPNGIFNDMGSPDFRETFTYVASELNKYNLAYLHILDGLAFGFHNLGEPMSLAEFRRCFDGAIIGNCGYTKETAEERLLSGDGDLIAFGRPFISNPDLVERFTNNWPLAPDAAFEDWYSFGEKGYADFLNYQA